MSSSRQDPDARARARATQRRLTRTSRAARAQIGATVALGCVATALIVAQATLLAHVIVDAFLGGASLSDLVPQLAWLLAVSLARGAVDLGFEVSGRLGAARVMAELRSRLVRHLLTERPGALSEERSGELAAAAVQGVDALEAYYARYLPQAVLAALTPLAILAWAVPRDWEAAAILAVTAPLVPVFMVLIGRLAEAATRRRWQRLSRLSDRFLDLVGGLATLRANGRAAAQADSIAAAGESYRRETMATLRIGFLSALVLELLAMIGVALVAATVGIQLAEGDLGLTAGLTVLILAPEVYMPLRRLGSEFHAGADAMAAAERIFAVLDRPAAVAAPGGAPRPAPDPADAPLVLTDVHFSHPGRERVLDGVDLTLAPGETVALVGPSGAGKSTLLSLLLRLAESDGGTISCGDVDLREVAAEDWRRRIAWVPQRPTIFAGTIAENVAFLRPDAGRGEIEDAARDAMLGPLLELLPDGLDTKVGEGGRRLSAGQAQRIGLARAFLSRASLVLLDEPTAHLDTETETEVAAAIDRLAAGRTALIVAHREAAIRGADRVVELRDGRIASASPRPPHRCVRALGPYMAPKLGSSGRGEDVKALRGILAVAPPRRGRLALGVALGAGAVLAAVGLLTTSGYLISRAAQRPEILALGVAIVGVRFFGISRALLRYAERLVSHDLAFRSLTDLRSHLFRRLVPLVPAGLPGLGRGELLGRFVGDVDSLQDLYLRGLAPPAVALVAGLGAVLVALLILPAAALALAAALLAAGIAVPLVTRAAGRRAGRRQAAARAELGAGVLEIAGGSAEIAVAGRAVDWIARTERSGARLAALQRSDAFAGGLAAGLLTAIAGATVVAILAVSIPAVDSGALPGVMLAALALLAMAAFEAVTPLGAAAAGIDACAAAATRIEAVLDRKPPVREPTPRRAVVLRPDERAKGRPPCSDRAKGRPRSVTDGPLRFEGVRFRYEPDSPWVLDGVDLALSPGRAVALLGPSGAGKSTLAELAVRFRDPGAGRIDLAGVPLTELAGDDVRAAVRLAPQDAYLFTSTLRDNVALGRPGAGDAAICAALEAVGLGPWLDSLPEGLDTEVGEAGARVSGGQRQRIAAARLFLARAAFLVFDEPTAHLDPAGAADLQRRIAGLAREGGPGVLVITHERAALDAFDEVLELRDGRIVAA